MPYKSSCKQTWYELNKEKFNGIVYCRCGGKHQLRSIERHKQSAKHIRWAEYEKKYEKKLIQPDEKKLIQPDEKKLIEADDVEILDFKLIISKLDGEYIPFNQFDDIEYIYTI